MKFFIPFVFSSLLFFSCAKKEFIKVKGQDFQNQNKTYKYIGCNYWYGGFIFPDTNRLKNELDFLKINKVDNLRVMISAEGDSTYPFRISPSLQEKQGVYNEQMMVGFDYLLIEAAKRNMKIVFVLNNNWEWSGGFGQYLEWNNYKNPPLPKTNSWDWDAYCNYISQFYSCNSCLNYYQKWIAFVVNRRNSINQKLYKEDETIMAWELANEPRPMKKETVEHYKNWIKNSAAFIKSIDKNHLITIGVEGIISTLMDEKIFEEIHRNKNIDYATIHLWPKTWQWYNGKNEEAVVDSTLEKTKKYIELHSALLKKINKPLVIEEFGLHRDENKFSSKSTTKNRDLYYKFIFEQGKKNNIAGYNFWGAFGLNENENSTGFMKKGMAYSADPPQEEQGLYSVFMNDSNTWKMIKKFTSSL